LLRDRWTRLHGGAAAKARAVAGSRRDDLISISYVERSNLNVRMDCRRFTRLANGYSKKLRRWFDESARACLGLLVPQQGATAGPSRFRQRICRVDKIRRLVPAR
jgi:hypothetical protein